MKDLDAVCLEMSRLTHGETHARRLWEISAALGSPVSAEKMLREIGLRLANTDYLRAPRFREAVREYVRRTRAGEVPSPDLKYPEPAVDPFLANLEEIARGNFHTPKPKESWE